MSLNSNKNYEDDAHSVKPGSFMYFRGQSYMIKKIDPADQMLMHVENIVTLNQTNFFLQELLLSPNAVEDGPIFASTLAALQIQIIQQKSIPTLVNILREKPQVIDSLRLQAKKIVQIVETVMALLKEEEARAIARGEKFSRVAATKRICTQLDEPISHNTYYKYRRIYDKELGVEDRIYNSLHRSTFQKPKTSKAQEHLLDSVIMRHFLYSNPANLYKKVADYLKRTKNQWIDPDKCGKQIPGKVVDELLNEGLSIEEVLSNPETSSLLMHVKLPSRSSFYKYLRHFIAVADAGKALISKKWGVEAWDREFRIHDTFFTRAQRPLEYVFADHYLIDVFTVDEETRSKIERLWLTLLIDGYTRCILGIALLYEAPCIESIQSALYHAIWPKESHESLGLEGKLVGYGIPLQLSLDNAWAHHSQSVSDLAKEISRKGQYSSIDLDFRPPYMGRYGGLIERLFGNFSARIKEELPGAIRSSSRKDIGNAAKEACLLYEDVYKYIYQLILSYQNTPHSGIKNMTPDQKWNEALEVFGLPKVPNRSKDISRLFWRKSPTTRSLTSKGICAFGMHYWSDELGGVKRVGRDGKKVKLSYRYDPSDISCLAIFLDGNFIGDVFAKERRLPDGSIMPISEAAWRLTKKLVGNYEVSLDKKLFEVEPVAKTRQFEKKKLQKQSEGGSTKQVSSNTSATKTEAQVTVEQQAEPATKGKLNEAFSHLFKK